MNRRWWLGLMGVGALVALTGCLKLPERVDVRVGENNRPPPVDSSRVPEPRSLEEARHELTKAYQNIQYLERDNARLQEKADKYKQERDEARKQLKRYEKD